MPTSSFPINGKFETGNLPFSFRERPFDFYGGGGGAGRFFEKNNQDSNKDKQNRQDDQANKKNIQDGVK